MKKMIALLVAGLLGVGAVAITQANDVTLEEAKEIALAEVGGEIISYEADDDEYTFEILSDDVLYDVEVSANTGKITDIEVETSNTANTNNTVTITREEAKEIALAEVSGTIDDIDLENGVYEVDIDDGLDEYTVYIDATTGEVLRTVADDDNTASTASAMSLEDAEALALAKIDGTLTVVETKNDEFTFQIDQNGTIFEVEVDRMTQTISSIEKMNNTTATITADEAREIALAEADGTITNVELDHGVYEVEVQVSLYEEWDITIDASTGEVLLVDKD